jgi:hypothetical protein
MSETSPQRGSRQRGDVGKREPGRTGDLRESDRDQPRRVATWARALAAVVLLDPSALPGPHSTGTLMTAQSVGTHLTSERPLAKRHHAGGPWPGSVPRTGRAVAAGPDVPTVLAVVDAAAALIEAGDEDSAFLLLALTEPASERPAGAPEALRLLTSTRPRAAACTPGRRSTAHMLPRHGSRGRWGGSA